MNLYDCKILLADDEKDILDINVRLFKEQGFTYVDIAENIETAEERLKTGEYHLAILDIMMPKGDGFSLYKSCKEQGVNTPVIFLSARDEEISRLRGLGLGADDYITKPYIPEELILRAKAVLRRTYRIDESQSVRAGDVLIDFSSGIVYKNGKEIELTAKEYILLSKLYENEGKIVSINRLMDTLWPDGSYGLENSLIVHIRRLREKIEENPSDPKHIKTARGLGYRFIAGNKL